MDAFEKMRSGQLYDANFDKQIVDMRYACFDACFEYNQTLPSDYAKKRKILEKILPGVPEQIEIVGPVTFDYGKLTTFGEGVFVNCYCYFMDGGTIEIGDHCFIGPYCGFYTAAHPIPYAVRNTGLETALPIKVGKNCWFGANVSVMPGVTIGEGCVIGAGSVVTKDLPANHICVGNPCKPMKKIDQNVQIPEI